jgi:hypothetical protein
MCQAKGLPVKAMFLWGLPGDNAATADAIVEWCRRYRPQDVQIWQYTPVPGSRLWEQDYGDKVTDYQTPWFRMAGEADRSLPNCVGNDQHTATELWKIRQAMEKKLSGLTRIDRGIVA